MTNEEIVKALRTCVMDPDDGGDCENCPANRSEDEYCLTVVMSEAASLIEQLIDENTELREEVNLRGNAVRTYEKKRAEAESERDALIEQIKERHDCIDCKHNDYCEFDNANLIDCMNCEQEECPCADCCDYRRWEWRGLPPEEGDT